MMNQVCKDPKKAVAIAKDVLLRLDRMKVRRGVYMATTRRLNIKRCSDLGDVVDKITPHCHVCALGGMFMSKAKLFDGITIEGLVYGRLESGSCFVVAQSEDCTMELLDIFDSDTLGLIEAAFELTAEFLPSRCDVRRMAMSNRAVDFGNKYETPKERLRAIMKNIIKNKGIFLP